MYTILCDEKSKVNWIVLLLAENGQHCNVVEDQSVDGWMLLSPGREKFTTIEQVKTLLKESQKQILHD